ncbi:MAG: mechanosensitive ion channel domain-containing protein [Myxococcota bacterium]
MNEDVLAGFDLSSTLESLSSLLSTWGLRVVGAIAFLVVGLIVARIVKRWTRKGLERTRLDETLVPFFASLAYYAVLTFVGIGVLGLFGIPTTSFVAVLGAAGLAIGLALQGSLSNLASGVMLLIFRPFRLGDYVEAGGVEGTVEEIGLFASSLATLDNTLIVLPNSAVWGATIKNFTAKEARRNDLSFGISYSDDIDDARAAILRVLRADQRVLADPAPQVWVTAMGESSVDLLVAPWCKPEHYWDLRFDLYQKVKEGLEAGGATIPFPQRDLHVLDMPKQAGA